jgi:hypothetical protein
LWASRLQAALFYFVKSPSPPPVESKGGVLMTNTLSPEVKSALSGITTDHFFTPEQFQKDIDYYRAQIITKALLDAELISLEEYHKLSELNAKSFSPFLVDIFPNTVDNTAVQR